MGAGHHEPLGSLGPIDWADVPTDGELKAFFEKVCFEAQTVLESVPAAVKGPDVSAPARARSKTDSQVPFPGAAAAAAALSSEKQHTQSSDTDSVPGPRRPTPDAVTKAQQLRKEWKEAKVNPRENPLGVEVYKLAGKDGRGAWFARRSVHQGVSFDHWKEGLSREFAETMKVQGSPGSGNIRGIGADRRVEDIEIPKVGRLQVYQLSAQFPGPTAPRDFITLLLTSDTSFQPSDQSQPLRQYMIVSKPCNHPECAPRQGIIRGQYESVELVRELPAPSPAAKRTLSAADLTTKGGSGPASAAPSAGPASEKGLRDTLLDDPEQGSMTVEWFMITRSDPGGSVPRFMVEKGTPPGIVGDAGKFLNWLTTKIAGDTASIASPTQEMPQPDLLQKTQETPVTTDETGTPTAQSAPEAEEERPSSNGLYGIISGALGVAGSVVPASLLRGFSSGQESQPTSTSSSPPVLEEPQEADEDTLGSDTSSIHSFASALEKSLTQEIGSAAGSNSDDKSMGNLPQEKELKKLQEKRRKLDEKAAKLTERMEQKRQGGKEKDAAAIAKAREKHEKEIAKQEAKYHREIRKLEEKREQEERKAEQRRQKAAEREEKSMLTLELEKTRTERDVALKRIEILEGQVGELQAQNTKLVADLGKIGGINRSDSGASSVSKDSKKAKLGVSGSPKLPQK